MYPKTSRYISIKTYLLLVILASSALYIQAQPHITLKEDSSLTPKAKALGFLKSEDNDSAIFYFKKAITQSKKERDTNALFAAYLNLAIPYHRKGNKQMMMAYVDSSSTLVPFNELHLYYQISLLKRRADIQNLLGNSKGTRKNYRQILKLAQDTNLPEVTSNIYTRLSSSYITDYLKNPTYADSAVITAKKAIEEAEKSGQDYLIGKAQNAYGTVLVFSLNKFDEGIAVLKQALHNFKTNNKIFSQASVWLQLSKCYYKIENFQESIFYTDSIIDLTKEYGFGEIETVARTVRLKALKGLNNYKEALEEANAIFLLNDSLIGIKTKEKLAQLEVSYQTREKDQKLKLLEAEKQIIAKEKQLLYIFISFILALGIGVVIFLQFRKKQIQLLSQQKEVRYKTELQNEQLKNQNLQLALEHKSRQLTSSAMQLAERNGLLQELLLQIENVKANASTGLEQIKQTLKQNLKTGQHFAEFKKRFEEVHPTFFEKMKASQPDLTEKELRLLAFSKLGLSIKEMAHLLHIEPNSVKVARYRLKKKFGLLQEESIDTYVAQM